MSSKKPDPSAAADENLGLAKLVRDLESKVDRTFDGMRREIAMLREENGRLHDRNGDLQGKLRELARERSEMRSEQTTFHNQARDTTLAQGREVRRLTERLDALEQVRRVATDPHQVVKPLQREIGILKDEIAKLKASRA
jgi:FtsZ-binding cell division protein ZapB